MSETLHGNSMARPETAPELPPAGSPSQKPEIYVAISNLSLPIVLQTHGGVAATEHYLEDLGGGQNGQIVPMEITPTKLSHFTHRLTQRGQQIEARRYATEKAMVDSDDMLSRFKGVGRWRFVETSEDAAFKRTVASTHQSPYDAGAPGFNPIGLALFRHYKDSMEDTEFIHEVVDGLPWVGFTEFEGGKIRYNSKQPISPDRSVQPKPGMWAEMGLEEGADLDLIRGIMKYKGFDSLTIDGFHIQNPQRGREFQEPVELANRLSAAGLVNAYHLALGRTDSTKGDPIAASRTQRVKDAFANSVESAKRTPEGEMLQQIVRDWRALTEHAGQPRRVVIETLPELNPLKARESTAELRAIVETARTLIEAA